MKCVCLHCAIAVFYSHWTIKSNYLSFKIPEISDYHCMNKLILSTAPTNIVEIFLIGNIKLHLTLHILYCVSISRFFQCFLYPILSRILFFIVSIFIFPYVRSPVFCILKKCQKFYIFFEIFCIICFAKMLQFCGTD